MSTIRDRFYHSQEWKRARKLSLMQHGGMCADCMAKGIYTPAKVVHHIKWLNDVNVNDAKVSISTENLVPLCQDCHAQRHEAEKRYKFDELGRVLI